MMRCLLITCILLTSTKDICKEVIKKNTNGPLFIMCTQIKKHPDRPKWI
jgi:hypothetical protein